MNQLKRSLQDLSRYPSAVVSLIFIIFMFIAAIWIVIAIPYREAVRLWRGGESVWYQLPKTVPPKWVNWFRREKLPETLILDTRQHPEWKTYQSAGDGRYIVVEFTIPFEADEFPQELSMYFYSTSYTKAPFVSLTWNTPDGRSIRTSDFSLQSLRFNYRFAQDQKLIQRLGGMDHNIAMFADPQSEPPKPLKGEYHLTVGILTFDADTDVDVEFIQYGKVYGWFGTDHMRRDLKVGLLWGLPVALMFGLLASVGTSLAAMLIAAIGSWYGGWVDDLIQRVTEVNLVLPFLPILIMVGTFYSRSIFVILGVTVLLSIFGGAIKSYRAIFLQVREMPYIEAARAYGAGDGRIILRYMVPRLIPLLIPALVSGIPSYVFLEVSLAVIGLGDPVLPTWGKIIQDAEFNGALYKGMYYWVLEPSFLLMVSGLAFAVLGFSLDRIFNPRLRGM
ncbi:MAG: ABC transporter permease [Anaerolineales bacterium]